MQRGDFFFIDKNSLKYFRLSLKMVIEMEKESIEMKLPEPYDDCEEATDNRLEHQSNCIESFVHGKIKKSTIVRFPLPYFRFMAYNNVTRRDTLKKNRF